MESPWVTDLYFIFIIFELLCMVSTKTGATNESISCTNPRGFIFEYANVSSFADDNRYIRLNISWDEPKANFTNFDMMIDSNCSALYGDRIIAVDQKYLILPSIERLPHPAEPLLHGCKYDFELYTEASFDNRTCIIWETISYKIPDCVDEVCKCGIAEPPYKYQNIRHIDDKFYEINFYKTDRNVDLELEDVFHRVYYTNMDSNKTVTAVHPEEIRFNNETNSITVPFNDIHEGNFYKIYIDLVLDECIYNFSQELLVPRNTAFETVISFATYPSLFIVICVLLILFTYWKTSPQVIEKLRRYLPFLPPLPGNSAEAGITKIRTEVINAQYIPLEFTESMNKFDEYEIPRHKIVLKEKIGGGAFGHVYKAEIYGFNNKPGIITVAAKKPIEHAPSEEISDFLWEIKTMKKIADSGGHPNIIKLMACVTLDAPYIMVMELVPCGSLKNYLSKLRKEWEQRKLKYRNRYKKQHFFPDNMVVEHYLRPVTDVSENNDSEKLKYSQLAFDDYTGCSISSGSNSYITPQTPSTPGSPLFLASAHKTANEAKIFTRLKASNKMMSPCLEVQSPLTPDSIASHDLPSTTTTLLTPLESEPRTSNGIERIRPVLDNKELQSFALQIASGMAFLEKLEITHRDLAARNILVSEDKILKISDFGMARGSVYVNITQKRQPLRWMAPEAIRNRRCDNKTDVWSFGVVLWEIGSLGAFPYKDLSNEVVIEQIMCGKRLERPETCTNQLYDLMQKCWLENPDDRPTFEEIAKQLDLSNGKIYVDFSQISPKYVFPPTQD